MVNGRPAQPGSVLEIRIEDRHGEVEGAVAVLVVDEEHAHELLSDIDFGGIGLLRPADDANGRVREVWRR